MFLLPFFSRNSRIRTDTLVIPNHAPYQIRLYSDNTRRRTWTSNPLLVKQLLSQLSYTGLTTRLGFEPRMQWRNVCFRGRCLTIRLSRQEKAMTIILTIQSGIRTHKNRGLSTVRIPIPPSGRNTGNGSWTHNCRKLWTCRICQFCYSCVPLVRFELTRIFRYPDP